jgi:hypothetical protein
MANIRLLHILGVLGILGFLVGSMPATAQVALPMDTQSLQAAPETTEADVLERVEVQAMHTFLVANGTSTTSITATALDSNDNPLPDVTVVFNTTHGSLESGTLITESTGTVTNTLTSSTTIGTATIFVNAVQDTVSKSASIDVEFGLAHVYLPLITRPVPIEGISIVASPTELTTQDGNAATITAQLLDPNGNAATGRHVSVTFTASWQGQPVAHALSPAVVTTDPATGQATTTLTNPDLLVGAVTISASIAEPALAADTTVTWTPLVCNDREPNNGMNEALDQQTVLTSMNAVCSASLDDGNDPADREGKEDDYYYRDLTVGSLLVMELREIPTDAAYHLSLTRFMGPGWTNPVVVAESTLSGNVRRLEYTVPEATRYFIRIRAEQTSLPDNPYLLLVRVADQATDMNAVTDQDR